jgi:flagellar biosynthesis protein FlhF
MRLKSYNAPTMAEAMRLVREELGDNAIIVSTQRSSDGQGVRITAALEDPSDDDEIERAIPGATRPHSPRRCERRWSTTARPRD